MSITLRLSQCIINAINTIAMADMNDSFHGFFPLVLLSEVTGIAAVVLMGIWMIHYRKGFAWQDDPSHEFNWHPFLMTIGLVFLYGNGILTYRVLRNTKKYYLKLIHASIMIVSFVLAVVALKAVFDSHNLPDPPLANLYSLHSWIGISTVALFAFQWCAGLIAFLLPGLILRLRAMYLPVHVNFGILIFILASAAALTGITEKLLFTSIPDYASRNTEGIIANTCGILIVIFGALVTFIATKRDYKRKPLHDE